MLFLIAPARVILECEKQEILLVYGLTPMHYTIIYCEGCMHFSRGDFSIDDLWHFITD